MCYVVFFEIQRCSSGQDVFFSYTKTTAPVCIFSCVFIHMSDTILYALGSDTQIIGYNRIVSTTIDLAQISSVYHFLVMYARETTYIEKFHPESMNCPQSREDHHGTLHDGEDTRVELHCAH